MVCISRMLLGYMPFVQGEFCRKFVGCVVEFCGIGFKCVGANFL